MIRIGCLGAARITPRAIVHPASVFANVELAGIACRDHARAEEFAARHGFHHVHGSYSDLIADSEVDLVYNPLPIHLHAPWTLAALRAGKHVLSEKPLAMNLAEAEEMSAAAKATGKRLIEALHYRHHPLFELYLLWLPEIGRLRRIEAHFSAMVPETPLEIRYLPETGGGAGMDLGCYPLSWTAMTTPQEPVSITATAALTQRGVDRRIAATFVFPDGLEADIYAAMDEPFRPWLKCVGDDGEIEFRNPLMPYRGAELKIRSRKRSESVTADGLTTFFHQFRALVHALENGETLPTEGAILLRQQRWLDAIYGAAGLGHLRQM